LVAPKDGIAISYQLSAIRKKHSAVGDWQLDIGAQPSGISRQMTGLHTNHSGDERTAEICGDAVQG
jgi:hypothetical protein